MTAAPTPEDLLRHHAPQVLGAPVRRYGHFPAAEEPVQEALLAAAVQRAAALTPRDGSPPRRRANPAPPPRTTPSPCAPSAA